MLNNLWNKCLLKLKKYISKNDYNIWILPLQVKISNKCVNFFAPNKLVLNYVYDNYLCYINKFILEYWDESTKPLINFFVGTAYDNNVFMINRKVDKKNSYKESLFYNYSKFNDCILLKKYSFGNFIYGKSNIFAYKESLNICDFSYRNYKLLIIYSNTGLGKTHLLHSIGNNIKKKNNDKNVIYINSERFVSKMVNSLYNNLIEDFKNYFKLADILLLDDIQFLSNKGHSQEEFFYILNFLLENNKFIVLSSNEYIGDLKNINSRIISRLYCGLALKIDRPDYDTRYKFILVKCKEMNLKLCNDIIVYISKSFINNFFELEGILNAILVNSVYLNCFHNISLNFVKNILLKLLNKNNDLIKVSNIKKITSHYYNISVNDLISKSRYKYLVYPRQMSIAISKDLTKHSLSELGKFYGGLDHSTVLYSCNKIKELCGKDIKVRLEFNNLIEIILSNKNEIYYKKK